MILQDDNTTHNHTRTESTMTNLTTKQRETLAHLFEIHSGSTEEIADHFGISRGAAFGRLTRLEEKGLIEKGTSEGTHNNSSSALKHVDWHCDTDDEDVIAALKVEAKEA